MAGPCDGLGAPRSVLLMSGVFGRVSALELRFVVLNDQPDWPVVQILVDGRDAFADQLPGWQGFDPADMLGDPSPLLPEDHGRRVAVYRCSCGIEGCGVIAPVIVPSPDGRRVSWVDFRDYVGVLNGPTAPDSDRFDGRPWPIADLHFERGQYIAEIRRASGDRSWETPGRITARLVADELRARQAVLPPDLRLRWAAPASDGDSLQLSFENRPSAPEFFAQQVLSLTSDRSEPELAARVILDRLQAVPPDEWRARFGWQRPRH
jgi:hypothetical protein